MNRIPPLATLLAALFTCCAVSAQTQLTQYRPGVTTDGAVYFLPKTGINVEVMVEKTTYQPGDFCRYAQRYLRQNDVSQEPSVSTMKPWGDVTGARLASPQYSPSSLTRVHEPSSRSIISGRQVSTTATEGFKWAGQVPSRLL